MHGFPCSCPCLMHSRLADPQTSSNISVFTSLLTAGVLGLQMWDYTDFGYLWRFCELNLWLYRLVQLMLLPPWVVSLAHKHFLYPLLSPLMLFSRRPLAFSSMVPALATSLIPLRIQSPFWTATEAVVPLHRTCQWMSTVWQRWTGFNLQSCLSFSTSLSLVSIHPS